MAFQSLVVVEGCWHCQFCWDLVETSIMKFSSTLILISDVLSWISWYCINKAYIHRWFATASFRPSLWEDAIRMQSDSTGIRDPSWDLQDCRQEKRKQGWLVPRKHWKHIFILGFQSVIKHWSVIAKELKQWQGRLKREHNIRIQKWWK